MTAQDKHIELNEFATFHEAQLAAAADATSSFTQLLPCVMYEQAERVYFSTGLPLASIIGLVKFDSAIKGNNAPEQYTNRPVMAEHVKSISEYLVERDKYILPGITLNVRESIRVYTTKHHAPVRLAIIIVPAHATYYVTDGQHRLKAIADAILKKPELHKDAVPVTIVVEQDIDQIHQDFADCAQTRAIPPALLTLYNTSDDLSNLTVEISKELDFFLNRLEKIGNSVSKRSLNFYTLNHLRMSIAAVMTGDSSSNGPAMQHSCGALLTTEQERIEWKHKLISFYNKLTDSIPEWKMVAAANKGTGTIPDIVNFRASYIHFTGTGLAVIGAVGNRILHNYKDLFQREKKIVELAKLIDWKRLDSQGNPNSYWVGTILTQDGKMVTSKYAVQAAVSKVMATLQLSKEAAAVA